MRQSSLAATIAAICFASSFAFQDNIDNSGIKLVAREVKCLVCRATVKEMLIAIGKVDPKKRVEVSGFRIDGQGNTITRSVQLSKSETYLTELSEEICDSMDDYVRARHKSNQKLTILKLTENGQMNPLMAHVDFVQDGDLNKSLKHYCLEVLEDNEDAVLAEFTKDEYSDTIADDICLTAAKYCDVETEEEAPAVQVKPVDEEATAPSDEATEWDDIFPGAAPNEDVPSADKQPEDEHLCKADGDKCDAGLPQPEIVTKPTDAELGDDDDVVLEDEIDDRDEL